MTGAIDRLEINHHVVTKDLILGHDIEMVAVTVLVRGTRVGTPLLVAVVGAQVGNHHNDALACHSTCSATGAGGLACGGQLVAFAAASTTPRSTIGVIEGLGASGCVDAIRNSELDSVCQ